MMVSKKARAGLSHLILLLALALVVLAPKVQAASKVGQITSSWTKAGKYSFKLKKNGTLVFKKGSGKEVTIAKKVVAARFCGAKVAYNKAFSYNKSYFTPCGIYDCASKKSVKTWKQPSVKVEDEDDSWVPLERVCGFYGNTLTFSPAWAYETLVSVNTKTKKASLFNHGEWVPSGSFQTGKYLVYLSETKSAVTLKVRNLSTGKTKVITKKGYAVSYHGGKLYYAEVKLQKKKVDGDTTLQVPKQKIAIYRCSIKGTGKKKLGSFSTSSKYRHEKGGGLRIVPGSKAVYVCEEDDDGNCKYSVMKYSTGKTKKSSRKTFLSQEKTKYLVSEHFTDMSGYFWEPLDD